MTTTLNDSRTQEAFDTVAKCLKLYAMICAIILGTLGAVTFTHHSTTLFEWIRATILLAISPFLYRLATRPSLNRLQTLTTIMPIAIIGVDLIPGVCPAWYACMQAISALPLIAVAFLTRRLRSRGQG